MAATSVERVAEYLINLSHDEQSPISNLKLQKLLYYCQAWHLAIFERPLFREDIEAWVHGPVVPCVFSAYRSYRWSPLPRGDDAIVSSSARRHIKEVWNAYGQYTAYDLERLTHSEDPWIEARAGLPPDASSHNVITKGSMMRYYSSRLNG